MQIWIAILEGTAYGPSQGLAIPRGETWWDTSTLALHLHWDVSLCCPSWMGIPAYLAPDLGVHWDLSSGLQLFLSWGNCSSNSLGSANIHRKKKELWYSVYMFVLSPSLWFWPDIPYHLIRSFLILFNLFSF